MSYFFINPFSDHDHTRDQDLVIAVLVHEVILKAEAVQNLVTRDRNHPIDVLSQMKRGRFRNHAPSLDLVAGNFFIIINLIKIQQFILILIFRSRSNDKQNGVKNEDK